jgi:hypothetical protein
MLLNESLTNPNSTTMIVCVSPASSNEVENTHVLNFARNACGISQTQTQQSTADSESAKSGTGPRRHGDANAKRKSVGSTPSRAAGENVTDSNTVPSKGVRGGTFTESSRSVSNGTNGSNSTLSSNTVLPQSMSPQQRRAPERAASMVENFRLQNAFAADMDQPETRKERSDSYHRADKRSASVSSPSDLEQISSRGMSPARPSVTSVTPKKAGDSPTSTSRLDRNVSPLTRPPTHSQQRNSLGGASHSLVAASTASQNFPAPITRASSFSAKEAVASGTAATAPVSGAQADSAAPSLSSSDISNELLNHYRLRCEQLEKMNDMLKQKSAKLEKQVTTLEQDNFKLKEAMRMMLK